MKNIDIVKKQMAKSGFLSHEITAFVTSPHIECIINSISFTKMLKGRDVFIKRKLQEGMTIDEITNAINKYYEINDGTRHHILDFLKIECDFKDDKYATTL